MLVKVWHWGTIDFLSHLITHILNRCLHGIGHKIVGIVGSQLINKTTQEINNQNQTNIGYVDMGTFHTLNDIQRIFGQLCNS